MTNIFELIKKPQEAYPGEIEDQERLDADLRRRPRGEREIIRAVSRRYEMEASSEAYQSDPSNLINFLRKSAVMRDTPSIVDLGCGSGNLVSALASVYEDKRILGIDLSSGFVRTFNSETLSANAVMRMGLIDSPGVVERCGDLTDGGVISVLTADRVTDPEQLVQNMAAFEGPKVLATLLPIIAEDDNPSRTENKLIYTPPEKRITPGNSAEEDKILLIEKLTDAWGSEVFYDEVPYTVTSSGDTQNYILSVFYT